MIKKNLKLIWLLYVLSSCIIPKNIEIPCKFSKQSLVKLRLKNNFFLLDEFEVSETYFVKINMTELDYEHLLPILFCKCEIQC